MAIEPEIQTTHVMVEVEEYNELMRAQKKLDALEAGGVDNWEWYDQAMENGGMYDEEIPDGR